MIIWWYHEIYPYTCGNSVLILFIFEHSLTHHLLPTKATLHSLGTLCYFATNMTMYACFIMLAIRVVESQDLSWVQKHTHLLMHMTSRIALREIWKIFSTELYHSKYIRILRVYSMSSPSVRKLKSDAWWLTYLQAVRDAYKRQEISNVGLIRGPNNPADGMTKPSNFTPLHNLLRTGKGISQSRPMGFQKFDFKSWTNNRPMHFWYLS